LRDLGLPETADTDAREQSEAMEQPPAPSGPPTAIEPPPTVEPAGTSANGTAADRICINSGDVDELARLHGVGRRAAQRIVEERDRSGSFGSLEDLERVDGFDSHRIRALGDRATIGGTDT
jgi:competence ComEA-like helix-hairpin-helix protein